MTNLEIEGKIVRKLAVQTGKSSRGEWQKQEFVVEFQEGNFPSSTCFNVWGEDKVKELEKFQLGADVKVAFNISSREFNGRWYTDLRAWRITANDGDRNIAGNIPTDVPPPQEEDFSSADFGDDLPF